METAFPEIFAPPGYFRADEAFDLWREIRHGHEELQGAARDAIQNAAQMDFLAGVKTRTTRKDFLFILDGNDQRHAVPRDVWERAAFPEMFFLKPQIRSYGDDPFARYDGSILCLERSEIELWARQELWDRLIDELKYGRLEMKKARELWANDGVGNLEGNPDPAKFDPMKEVFWTLPMAVAWIAWRDTKRVAFQWEPYRSQCHYFESEDWNAGEGPKGWVLKSYDRASLDLMISTAPAKRKLWEALQSGSLTATGKDQSGKRLLIDAVQCQERAAMLNDWQEVTVERDAVLAKWPKPVPIWDFALAKCNNNPDLAGRLVAEIYAAFWKDEFGVSELTLADDNDPGVYMQEGLDREYLAGAALGGPALSKFGYPLAFEQLAAWNMADYAKVNDAYRHYFVPSGGIGSLSSQGRGLCAPPDVLGALIERAAVAAKDVLLITTQDKTEAAPKRRTASKAFDPKKLQVFFETHSKTFKDTDYPPNFDEDWEAAKVEFPGIGRAQIRDCRNKAYESLGLESWIKPGPRKTIGELRSQA